MGRTGVDPERKPGETKEDDQEKVASTHGSIQGSGSGAGTQPVIRSPEVVRQFGQSEGGIAPGGTPALGTDPKTDTMNTEPESPVWGADWWREIYYGIVSLAALCCCGARSL